MELPLYLSHSHPCAYLEGREARIRFVDPAAEITPAIYGALLERGFRRSGSLLYRPDCTPCDACIPVRIPVSRFRPRRIQRRVWKRCIPGMEVVEKPPIFATEHFQLYRRYLQSRHGDGEMAGADESAYLEFLTAPWCETRFLEFRRHGRLFAVAVTDQLPQGRSAVYTFFDPADAVLSPGTFAILWQIDSCRRMGLPWLYLGYWIAQSRKMAYKAGFRPIQSFIDGIWNDLP
jgi:arginyl-tRNA--protein-N-Asp/Glu arginylyltransferase